ncbi:MAG: prepilin-type N-terminal cleavage/methylation domain-containing protein [Minisyncoccia bacterium]
MNKQKGFTLIELLVVIAVIGILASVVMASLNSARVKARDAKRLAGLREIQTAVELYYSDNGHYPILLTYNNTSSGDVLWLTTFATMLAPYITALPTDGTNGGYLYSSTNGGAKYGLAVHFEGSSYSTLTANDGGNFSAYYEVGPSPAGCFQLGIEWWGATTINC